MTRLLSTLLCLWLTTPAFAGGSSWGSISNIPAEDNNVLGTLYAEQDKTAWQRGAFSLKPFINGTLSFDSKGYDWNNKLTIRGGGKLQYDVGTSGIIALRFGAAYEERFKSGDSYVEPFISAEYWFGWGQDSQFPGSSWGIVGNVSPAEKSNVHFVVHAEQGLFAQPYKSGTFVPFVETTLSRDTDDFDWNNKNAFGAGVKYRHPVGTNGTFDIAFTYQYEERTISGRSDDGLVLSIGYWVGW